MVVFIGSSSHGADDLKVLENLIVDAGMRPVPWINPDTFALGTGTWEMLLRKAREVFAAVFLFREDDEIKQRDQTVKVSRDNVILEFGLFTGRLGPERCAFAKKGNPQIPTDLAGLTYIDLNNLTNARNQIDAWAKRMRDKIFAAEIALPALGEKRVAAIVRAMKHAQIPQGEIEVLMHKLGIERPDIDRALHPRRSPK